MSDMKFTRTHEWIKQDADAMMMGITDHAQQLLGDLVFVELPEKGRHVQAGEELGVVESVKAASDFYAPVSGVVQDVNQAVGDNPALVNNDPEGLGWLVRIRPDDVQELNQLLTSDEYAAEVARES